MTHERAFTAAYDAVGVLPPAYEPRATGHVPQMVELMQQLVETGHAYVAGDGDVYFDVRSYPDYGSLTNQRLEDMVAAPDGAGRGRRGRAQARPPRLRAVEGPQAGRAGDRGLADAVRPRPPRLAPRVLGDGPALPRRRVRHPRRRPRPALPAPRERAGAVPRGGPRLRPVLAAQRLGHAVRRQDEQVARQRAARHRGARPDPSGRAAVRDDRGAVPLDARVGARTRWPRRRPPGTGSPGFVERAVERVGAVDDARGPRRRRCRRTSSPRWTTTSTCPPRSPSCTSGCAPGNSALAAGRPGRGALRRSSSCGRCSDVLGLDPAGAQWSRRRARRPVRGGARRARRATGSRPARRRAPRATSPPPTRSGTASRPPASWSRTHRPGRDGRWPPPGRYRTDGRQLRTPRRDPQGRIEEGRAGRLGRAGPAGARGPRARRPRRPSARTTRPASARPPGQAGQAGTGRRDPPGRRRPDGAHLAVRRRLARHARASSATHEIVSGRNSVVEALRAGIPVSTVYFATRLEADDRTREILAAVDQPRATRCSRSPRPSSTG